MSLQPDSITIPGQLFACLSIVGPDCPQKTDKFGIKIRGVFSTTGEAQEHAKKLQQQDATFDIYVVDMFQWLLIPPTRENIENVHYADEKLEELMSEYKKNQAMAAAMFSERQADMAAKPLEGIKTPFIKPGDENSKYYNKPDVPPSPHPADLIDDIKKEFPDASIEEVVRIADQRVAQLIKERAELEQAEAEKKDD